MSPLLRTAELLFAWVIQTSLQASILALLILLAQMALRQRLAPAWRYGLWLLLVVRLLLPNAPQTMWSIYNLAKLPGGFTRAEELSEPGPFGSAFFPPQSTAPNEVEPGSASAARGISATPVGIMPKRIEAARGRPGFSSLGQRFYLFIWIFGMLGSPLCCW